MMPVLLICIGNEFRGDDRVAWILADQFTPGADLRVLKQSGEGTALMHAWSQQPEAKVILVDAMKSGKKPGTVQWWPSLETIPAAGSVFRCSSHQFGVLEAIAMARELGKLPCQLAVLGIEGENFHFGTELSAGVQEALPEAEKILREEIQKCMK